MAETYHDNPWILDKAKLAISQKDETFPISSDTDFLPNAKVVACYVNTVIKTYTIGDGIEITTPAIPRVVNGITYDKLFTLTVQGIDFERYRGNKIQFVYMLWEDGNRDAIQDIEIKKSKL